MWYFAYGSNMNFDRMRERILREPIAKAGWLVGYCLLFNKVASKKSGVGYANIKENKDENVYGVLYDVTQDEIAKLDGFEGVPRHYEKKEMEIKSGNGNVTAVVYIANKEQVKDGLLPERAYLNHLLKGKEYLPMEYYKKLEKQLTID